MSEDLHQWGKEEIAREILKYLSDHPDASDTREGIIAWWLMERRIKYQSMLVQETLAKLVEEGTLFEIQIDQSPPVYGLKTKIQNSDNVTDDISKKNGKHS
jgi:hypothetical protein